MSLRPVLATKQAGRSGRGREGGVKYTHTMGKRGRGINREI